MEADRQQSREGRVWETLRRVVADLERISTSYAVVGGMALQHYGVERSTQVVDLLVTGEGLAAIHATFVGHGYSLKSPGSRHVRDDITRVRIEFLVSGEYPGDGLPKPVRFVDPATLPVTIADGIRFADTRTLVEMKLASAKSAAHRIKDRADVLELIHLLGLDASWADQLNPYVRAEFKELAALPPPFERD